MPFKPYRLTSVETYSHRVEYYKNGEPFYMKVWAKDEKCAVSQVKYKEGEIEVIRVVRE